jgi:hypothetical protein
MLKKYIIISAFMLITPIAYANHDIVGDRCAPRNDGTAPCHFGNSANAYDCRTTCNERIASRGGSGGTTSQGGIVTSLLSYLGISPKQIPSALPAASIQPTYGFTQNLGVSPCPNPKINGGQNTNYGNGTGGYRLITCPQGNACIVNGIAGCNDNIQGICVPLATS